MLNIVNHTALIEAGHATRFGPDWPGRRCGAKTRAGGMCQNPATRGRTRCKLHGGKSAGPVTEQGRKRCAEAKTVHGWETREKRRVRATKLGELRDLEKLMKLTGLTVSTNRRSLIAFFGTWIKRW